MPYTANGKDVFPYVDFDTFEPKPFYDMLRGGILPTTCALNPEAYKEYFEPEFKKGNDIFYVHFSRAMSATFDFMDAALKELKVKYPERKFYEVDTKFITIGSYNILLEIGELFLKGKSVDYVLDWAKTEVDKFAVYFYADDLKFFRKSGRVTGLAAVMGSILKICPIIYMNSDGVMTSIGKERGRRKALERLVQYVVELGDNVTEHKVIIGHCDAQVAVDTLIEMLQAKFDGKLDIEVIPVNPTAGSHCGPDSLGVCFHAIHR